MTEKNERQSNRIVFLIKKKNLVFRKNRISIHQRISISLHIHRIFLRLLDIYVQIPPQKKLIALKGL